MIEVLRKFVRRRRDLRQVSSLKREWKQIVGKLPGESTRLQAERDVLLIPPEPMSLIGSKGDEAMLVSVISTLSRSGRQVDVAVGSHWKALPAVLLSAGAHSQLPIWDYKITLSTVLHHLANYKEVILVGADVMDGYYSASKSYRFLMIADIASKMGLRSSITGFSFNENPAPSMGKLPFDAFSRDTRLCLRDPVSLGRFTTLSRGLGSLTGDVAFLLSPDNDSSRLSAVRSWADNRRQASEFILGFNIHPALLPGDPQSMDRLIQASIAALQQLIKVNNTSVLLVSHDARATSSDSHSLKPIFQALSSEFPESVYFIEADHSAAELKAVAGLADAIFTGRMHLSIAALGMGVPVGWATYQGKFEGLAQHFSLPEWLLLDPLAVSSHPGALIEALQRMIVEQPILKKLVTERLPTIKKLALSNLVNPTNDHVTSHN